VTAAAAAVEVDGLAKRYGDRPVIADASFTVAPATVVALLGPNGAGKTTTVEILEGYRSRDSGAVRVLGLDPAVDGAALRPRVGVMLQAGGLYPLATPRELVRLFGRYVADPRPVAALLDLVELTPVADARVRTLSGGERQRLSLALALVGRPELLILDEPTAGMDPEAKQRARELLENLRGGGTTVLLTTHELSDVARLADRVVVLDGGRIVADGPPDELGGGERPILRFRLAGAPPDATLAALGAVLAGRLSPEPGGWYRIDGIEPDPGVVARVASECAARDLQIAELRVGGGTLEERYLALVGDRAVPV